MAWQVHVAVICFPQNRGIRMKEGAHINLSLLALANCINTLCSGAQYINFRDSKLTRLLKDALSGNCQTVMIAHISPASTCYEESKNTLKYADRAKHLKTKVSKYKGFQSQKKYCTTHNVDLYKDICSYSGVLS